MKNKKLYCCYSIPLRDYLVTNGLRYEICAKNPNSNNLMWVFIRTTKLNDYRSYIDSKLKELA